MQQNIPTYLTKVITFTEAPNIFKNFCYNFTLDIPQLNDPIVVERCVSYLYVTWNDTTQCVPVNYTVMLSNTSSGELLHSDTTSNNSYNFTGLTSDTLYSVTITGRNRVGQDVVMNHSSSLQSESKVLHFLFLHEDYSSTASGSQPPRNV